jgi:hypothetical protein
LDSLAREESSVLNKEGDLSKNLGRIVYDDVGVEALSSISRLHVLECKEADLQLPDGILGRDKFGMPSKTPYCLCKL